MMYKSSKNDALAAAEEPRLFFQRIDLSYWAPPVLWMAAIFLFSTDLFSGSNTGGIFYRFFHLFIPSLTPDEFRPWNFLIRKLAHFTEYAILAMTLFRAFRFGSSQRWRWKWAASTLAVVAIYALLDEYHQTWTANRVGSIYDSMIDVSGGATALLLLWLRRRRDRA
jgi:VanZ family protein